MNKEEKSETINNLKKTNKLLWKNGQKNRQISRRENTADNLDD